MLTRSKTRNQLIKLLGALVIGGLVGVNVAEDRTRSQEREYGKERKVRKKVAREGTAMVNQMGVFKGEDDDFTFTYDQDGEPRELKVLENLALERVANELLNASTANPPRWSVTGTLTEFRGTNYILLRRTVLRIKR